MTPSSIALIGTASLIAITFTRMSIGIVMGFVGVVGFAVITGVPPALGLLKTVPFTSFADETLCVLPLFLLMGNFAFNSGLSEDMYRTAYVWLGRFRGGLAMATVVACALFAAISGSAIATAATLCRVAMPEMKKYNYHPMLSTGALAAGGTIGIMIPPSVILLLYGILTEQSIAKLFIAGFIPGIMQAMMYMVVILIMTKMKPQLGPPGPKFTMKEKVVALKGVTEVAILFIVVIGGLYAGIFAPTEAAGVGAFGAFICLIFRRKLSWETLKTSLFETSSTTGMLFLIILGAMLLNYFLSVTRLPFELATWVSGLQVNKYVIFLAIVFLLIFLGAIMDELAIMLLTIPVLYPMVMNLGFDPIWFGVMATKLMEMGMILPPVGMNVFVIQGMTGVPMGTIYKGTAPFLLADFIQIILLLIFPEIITFAPNLL
ncbi:MAG: TRAP transporter large permease [Proteobacteria bacterium]|nr:TRAP transporter large permease [Pseudomonadota bacterium]